MPQRKYDLICIGGGPAGQKAAIQATRIGKKAAMIDNATRLGGASVHTGTVPSKTLQEISRFLHRLRQEAGQGLRIHAPAHLPIQHLLARDRIVVHVEEDVAEEQVARNDIDVIRGFGRLTGPNEVEVELLAGGRERLGAKFVLLATGSRPRRPAGIPFEDQVVYDSNGVMSLRRLPTRLAVIGAGIIGCEYATIFANLGVRVHLFDIAERVMGWADHEVSETLTESMRLMGISICPTRLRSSNVPREGFACVRRTEWTRSSIRSWSRRGAAETWRGWAWIRRAFPMTSVARWKWTSITARRRRPYTRRAT